MPAKRNAPTDQPAQNQPDAGRRDSGQPGGGQGRTDVTGIISEDVRIDPDLTEGHSGYEESGDSEIIPDKKPAST